jgi:stage IV sporulation protein FB
MFFEPERTQFDLSWRMLGAPVRVHPWFWVMSLMLGWDNSHEGLEYVFIWVVCVFVSILVHEFGHVLMGRLFGAHSHVVLHALGGLAVGSSALHNRWQRIAVYLAGPGAGFILGGFFWLVSPSDNAQLPPLASAALEFMIWINVGWGILNLLPIWPLDGGRVCRDYLDWAMPEKGLKISLAVSIITCGLLAVNALTFWSSRHALPLLDEIKFFRGIGGLYNALFFGALALNSYQALQQESARRPWDQDVDRWQR